MPSEGVGSLYGGLAQGIFGRLREHEDEQKKQDFEQKGQTLKYLSSLVDEATPETRPILLNTMADTIGLKGKHRGVWDMLTGRGRDDYHQQLSGMLSKVTGNVVGPEEYERRKPKSAVLPMPGATGLDPVTPGVQAQPDQRTGQEIVLRDPDRIALDKLRTQYGLKYEADMSKLAERDALQSRREELNDQRDYKYKLDTDSQKAHLAAFKPIMERAQAISGGMQPTPEAMEQAAQEHAAKLGLDIEKLRETIPGLKARAYRDTQQGKFYESQVGVGQPGMPGYGMKPGEMARFDQGQQQAGTAIYGKWKEASAKVSAIDPQVKALREQIKVAAKGKPFDEARGVVLDPATGQPDAMLNRRLAPLIADLAKLSGEKARAEQEMQGHHQTLSTQYGDYFQPGTGSGPWWIEPKQGFGGVAPAGATRTGQRGTPPPFPAQASMPNQSHMQWETESPKPKGTVMTFKGQRYRVTGVVGKSASGKTIMGLEPVQ